MALFITLAGGREVSGHIGDNLGEKLLDGERVIEMYADGDELDLIQQFFTGLPKISGFARETDVCIKGMVFRAPRSLTWHGDDAAFIVSNWPTAKKG